MAHRPRVVISACLLGEPVRYDGSDKAAPGLVEALARHAELIPVCPEVECGLPVPRPPMRLVGDPAAPRMVVIGDGADHTDRLHAWLTPRLEELAALAPTGFVLKAGSPSCGVAPMFDADGRPVGSGGGLFARAVCQRFPGVPIVEEAEILLPDGMSRFLVRIG